MSYREAIDSVMDETGDTIREIIEHALLETYPGHFKQKSSKQR